MRARAFITPKAAECEVDCQDRFSINAATGSVAVSDGMSQSLFPKFWAAILAEKYTSDRSWVPSRENIRALTEIWRERVDRRLEEWRQLGVDPWRSEGMLADGASAGATLVGLRMDSGGWKCDLLGDSCLLEVEGESIKAIHSSMDPEHFDNYPDYFDSNPLRSGKGEVKTISGDWNDGQTMLLLVTDALAAFLASVRGTDRERACVKELLSVESADEFRILVDYWRKEGMHDDDTTLVVISDECCCKGSGSRPAESFKRQEEWIW